MKIETKEITVLDYDSNWPKQFDAEAIALKTILKDHCIEIHHIGSTSVPGLAAKPEIDILCIVDALESSLVLSNCGYTFKGELNIPFRYYFSKNTIASKVNLHVTESWHTFKKLNLCFRNFLRAHDDVRDKYTAHKQKALQDPKSYQREQARFPRYTLGKDKFIKDVLKQANFNELCINFCLHDNEWAAAKECRNKYFFEPHNIQDPYAWTFDHKDHKHFILYKGVEIVGYAHIQLWPENRAAVRIIAIDETTRAQGYGREFMQLIEKWLKYQDYQSIHAESSPAALKFYEKLGFTPMAFKDPDGYESSPDDIAMGKFL